MSCPEVKDVDFLPHH